MKIFILIVIAIVLFFFADMIIESFFLLTVRCEKYGGDLKIVQISDLHRRCFGKNNIDLINKTAELSPDVIFITGDLVSRTENDLTNAEAAVKGLCAIAPVYMIMGNHEQDMPADQRNKLLDIISENGAVLLRNQSVSLKKNNKCFNICGYEPPATVYKKNGKYKDLDTVKADDLYNALGKPKEGINLLLAHNPLFAEVYAQWGADHTFSGHVHGGVVRFFGKGILSPERKFFPKYTKGVYTVSKMKLMVSAGLGKLRIMNPPEIVVYEI